MLDQVDFADIEEPELAGGNQSETFKVDTLDKAAWAAAKLKEIRRQQAARRALAEQRIAQWQRWAEQEIVKLDDSAVYFNSLLEGYMRQEHEANPKQKSIVLPDATLHLRKKPDTYQRDENELLQWVEAAGLPYRKTVTTLCWGDLKAHIKSVGDGTAILADTGEIVPTVTVIPGEVKFSVEITPTQTEY